MDTAVQLRSSETIFRDCERFLGLGPFPLRCRRATIAWRARLKVTMFIRSAPGSSRGPLSPPTWCLCQTSTSRIRSGRGAAGRSPKFIQQTGMLLVFDGCRRAVAVRNGESGGKIARCETRHPNRWFVGRRHSDLRLRGMAGVSYSHSLPMVVDGILSVDPASFAVRLRCCRSSIHMADRRFRASGAGAERARGSRRDRRNWFRSRFFRADGSRSRFASRAAVGHLRDRSAGSSSWSRRRRRFLGEAALIRF